MGVVRAKQTLRGAADIEAALEGLVARNVAQMQRREFPPLARKPVRYRRERRGLEHWRSAAEVLRAGAGDCEDLAAYHVAWLRSTGRDPEARVMVRRVRPGLLHVAVQLCDGTIVDPSKFLGMKGQG